MKQRKKCHSITAAIDRLMDIPVNKIIEKAISTIINDTHGHKQLGEGSQTTKEHRITT